MAKNNVTNLLTSVDELFTTQEERDITKREMIMEIPLSEISEFPNHPFKVDIDERMLEMVESVKKYGVLVPAIIRPKNDGTYEMISGHRRKMASELAEKDTLNCIVRDMTDDEAIIVMVDSNLQRETILPSEKAFAYKMKLDAMKRQGYRADLTSAPVEPKLNRCRSNELLAAESPDSRAQIQRYIRLTNLIPEILQFVDEDKIGMRPAVEISYLLHNEQQMLFDAMATEACTPTHAQTIIMRQASQKGELTKEKIFSIMAQEKPNQKEQFRIPKERISKYFSPGTPAQKIEDTIIKALEFYRKKQREIQR